MKILLEIDTEAAPMTDSQLNLMACDLIIGVKQALGKTPSPIYKSMVCKVDGVTIQTYLRMPERNGPLVDLEEIPSL